MKAKMISKLFLACAASLVFALSMMNANASSINVSGAVTVNTTWSEDTIHVVGDVMVNNGVSLVINPGVLVLFDGPYRIDVQGSMQAVGTIALPVMFTCSDTSGFSNMSITGGGWHGIRFDSTAASNDTSRFTFCHFEYGKASGSGDDLHGGAIFIYSFSKVKIINNTFYHCYAANDGGAIYVRAATALVSANVFSDGKSARGAGVACDNAWPRVEKNTFYGNYATSMGGCVAIISGAAPDLIGNLMYSNLAYLGGAIAFFNAGNLSRVVNGTITNNRANYGGGVSSIGTNATFENTILYGNIAAAGHEVTLLDTASDPGFNYCDVQGGSAEFGGSGNGPAYSGSYTNNMNAWPEFKDTALADYQIKTISPCLDAGNPDTTGLQLPALDLAGNPRINMGRIDIGALERQQIVSVCGNISQNTLWNADTVKVTCGLTVDNGVVLSIASGVYVEFQGYFGIEVKGSIQANGVENEEITFVSKDTVNGWTGFLFDTVNTVNDSSLFVYCKVTHVENDGLYDGAFRIINTDKIRMDHCLIEKNSGTNGGAMSLWDASPYISNSSITDNHANIGPGMGGAVYAIHQSMPVFVNTNLIRNDAALGGAVYCAQSSLTLDAVMIANNYAGILGGGILSDTGQINMVNTVIANNTSNFSGGAVAFYFTTADFVNSDVVQNYADTDGGGLYISNTDLSLQNCIIHGNGTDIGTYNQLTFQDSNCVINISYCDFLGDSADFIHPISVQYNGTFTNNLDTLPLFVDPSSDMGWTYNGYDADWSLQPCSPLYNMGNPDTSGLSLPATDFMGYQRIFADTVDIGATEVVRPTIAIQPDDVTICEGGDVTFVVEIESNIDVTYEWQVRPFGAGSFSTAPGTYDEAEYSLTGVSVSHDGDQYQCVITADCSPVLTTNSALLTVETAPDITTEPVDEEVCQGATAYFDVVTTGSSLNYQWQQRPFGSATWSNCIGATATTPNYSIPSVPLALNNYSYRCILSGSCEPSDTSLIVDLTVFGLPAVVTNPTNVTVCEGGNANFTVSGSGAGLTYQWQLSTNGGSSWSDISGEISTSLSMTAVTFSMNGYRYRCVISGDCNPSVNSNAAILTVNTPPLITTQPSDINACVYSNVTISIAASGGNLSYQWQQKAPGDIVWSNAPGLSALTANYQLTNVSLMMDSYKYQCLISGNCAPGTISDSIVLNVHNLPAFYIGEDTTILLSETIILDAGMGFSSYLWSTTETSQAITVIGSVVGVGAHQYSCTITDANGCENNDALLVTVLDDTGIEEGVNACFSVFEDAGNQNFMLSCITAPCENLNLRVFTMSGALVYNQEIKPVAGQNIAIPTANWSPGLYLLNLTGDQYNSQIKLLKRQ